MSTAQVAAVPDSQRKGRTLASLKRIVHDLTGIEPERMDTRVSFLDAGVDSLMLIQATQSIQDQFGIKLSVVQMIEELNTLDAVADFIEQSLPPEDDAAATATVTSATTATAAPPAQPEPPRAAPAPKTLRREDGAAPQASSAATTHAPTPLAAPPPPARPAPQRVETQAAVVTPPPQPRAARAEESAPAAPFAEQPGLASSVLEQLMAQQLQVMAQQLDLLRGVPAHPVPQVSAAGDDASAPSPPPQAAGVPPAVPSSLTPSASPAPPVEPAPASPAGSGGQPNARKQIEPELFIPYQPIEKGSTGGLTARQQRHLDEFIRSYNERTRESKRLTQEYRPYVADSRVSAGFRLLWKELVYQLFGARSAGPKLWDVDGNEYVDITMGFGLHLFGHSPDFVVEAIERQLREGIHLGPQTLLAGEVAKLICELTGLERVNFCNSGTEAVMGALRIARTVTRRTKIALFAGAYHGWADPTLTRAVNRGGERVTSPMAPGVPPLAVAETLVLDWNDPRSLDTLRAHAHELACVLVEPVQSRRPDVQPREFLHELRRITAETGVVLIIDEMVTGFRVLPGGAQKWFGVQADLAIYGKVLGAGLPLGIVAGKAEFMDAFDGGMWDYGDSSYPRAEKTLFAGAYFKHPLTMAVAHAFLTRLRDEGEQLLADLNGRTTRLAETLDAYFAAQQVPARVVNYGSLFRILFSREYKFIDLFYYHLVHNGVFIWEGRNCFLSTAHGEAEVGFIVEAVKRTVEQMRAGGFLPELPPDAPTGGDRPERTTTGDSHAPGVGAQPQSPQALAGAGAAPAAASTTAPALITDRAERREPRAAALTPSDAGLKFSLYYFGNYPVEYYTSKYELLFKGVSFADRHGFEAVWLPERHFNSYGGFSPNPSILAAALAAQTERIHLRAGSCVLPLHDPIRVAEDWAVIDNLSRGRVGISFASGWHPNDFVFAPDDYERRRDVMDEGIEIVKRLWRGETIERRSGRGDVVKVGLSALPATRELPTWITGGSHGTGAKAGKLGAGFLTNLQDQTIDELAEKIGVYHESLARHGHAPETAHTTVLLHTYVVDDLGKAVNDARGPFRDYLRSAMGLRSTRNRNQGPQIDLAKISEADLEYFLSAGFERYKQVGTLIGTPDSCSAIIDRLIRVGVTEVGCLIDFGVPTEQMLESLHHLNVLRERYQKRDGTPAESGGRETLSLAASPDATADATAAPDGAARRAEGYSVPLTETQKQFWFLTQLGDHVSRQYNESITLRLRGPFDAEAMRAALNEMVARHDALRSTFSETGESQQIHPAVALDVPLADFSHVADGGEREARAAEWARELGRRPFDMARGPVVRAAFARLEEQLHLLLFTTHHIVADGQAWGVMLNDLRELYAANCLGRPAALPPPLRLDEQARRRATLSREEEAQSEAYWLAQFADGFPAAELPTDRPRPPAPSYERAQVYADIGADLGGELKALSRGERSTLFITLLAGYSLLLHQLTGRDDLAVGINAADPLSVRRKDAVGYRLNPQTLRSRLAGDPTFKEHLAATRRRVYEAYEHQRFPAAKLLKSLKLRPDPRRAPLVAAGLNLDHTDPDGITLHGLEVEFDTESTSAPSLDIYLDIREARGEMRLKCNYNTDVFDAGTVARWLEHFRTLLASAASDPERRVSELPQFSAAPAAAEPGREESGRGQEGQPDTDLTKFQRLLWAGQRLNPEEVIYVNLGLIFIGKEIDPAHLRAAFRAIIDRSDALRTVIEDRDGVPRQRVLAELPYELEFFDFSREADPRARLDDWARERRRIPLDMATRMFDSALVKLSERESVWYLNVHHVVADAWSFFVVCQHGLDYYENSVAGRLAEQPGLPPFRDYIAHEAAMPRSRKYREAEAYWREKLSEQIEPPHFYGRPPVKRTTRVERVTRKLGAERTRRLKEAAARPDLFTASEDATLSILFAALTAAFVSRVSGGSRVALGVPFHNRTTADFQRTVGLFMQILPLRVSVERGDTFLTLAQKLRAEFFAALRHHEYGVGNPLHQQTYDVECNYITARLAAPDGTPVRLEWPHSGHAHESLALQVHDIERSGDLTVNFDFHLDVFGPEQREQAVGQFFRMVDAFIEDGGRAVQSVGLLSDAEARRVLVDFNQTAAEFPLEETFPRLFEAQVRRTPDAAAVVADDHTLTYAELNERANRLARQLRALGAGPDVIVPLVARRGADLLAAIIAVFKAGGAYLPLDPLYPPQRLLQLIAQSRASLLLTAGEVSADLAGPLKDLSARSNLRVVALEELLAREADGDNLPSNAGPGSLAYVIYTSGSTGVPKGAMLEQRGMVNHLFAKVADLGLTAADTVVQNASQSFDISVWQFLAALVVGARVRVVGDEAARDAGQLWRLLDSESVTVFETVPSMLRAMLAHREADETPTTRPALAALRWMIVTGEALPPELCRRWLAAYPRVPLVNAYGPTECSDDVTHHFIDGPPADDATGVPIGRPVANTQLYVLDAALAPVPTGVPAELFVGGAGVGRGYLDDPARTAAAFVPDPFSPLPGARLYRTGDLARWATDGTLEFLGRVDHQVKIRGHRIELGEIETVLGRQAGVLQAVVAAREDEGGEKRLVAYVVAREGEPLDAGQLRAALKERLPEYMTPSAFVRLDALPLSANGKVDLKALPAPDPSRPELEAAFVAPRGAAEESLAEIFRQVLNVERVGAHDNYFELGGDSILSIQIASRAAQAGLRLTPIMLFEHQTVAALARAASDSAPARAEQGAVAGEFPLTPIQRWFFERELANPHHYNQAVLLEAREPIDSDLLRRAVEHLLRHHDMLGARFEPRAEAWGQRIPGDAAADAPYSHHDLSGLPERERRAALEAEAARQQGSLHLARGPLARFAFFDLGAGQPARLLLVAHHLVVDAVSWRVLIEDLQTAYERLRRGDSVELPSKTTSYKDWSGRLAAHAGSAELLGERDYWLDARRASVRPLPRDDARGENLMASSGVVSSQLSREETQSLLKGARATHGAQINDVLLAALARVVNGWSGARALTVNLESHGREEALFPSVDLTRTVGWFTTISPVLLDLTGAATPAEELAAVKDQLRLVPRRGIGYGVLRYLSGDPALREALRAQAAAEISFNYLGQTDQATPESGLFKLAAESAGPTTGREGRRAHVFEVNGLISGGRLRFDWSFSRNLHRRETVERLARDFADALREFAGIARPAKTEAEAATAAEDAAATETEAEAVAETFSAAQLADFNWGQAEADDVAAALNNLES